MSAEIVVPVALFAMVVLIIWIAHLSNRSRIQQRAELRRHLLDKFNSGQDLSQFLATSQGQSFLKELEIGDRTGSAKARVLRSISAGIILLFLGGAFFALMRYEHNLIFAAVILLALGIAFLIAAGISYVLSKKWGIFDEGAIELHK